MFGYVGEAWRRLLVDIGVSGALAALSMFMNCDRQLGGLR
jgi:putative exporter of polyketide antibiotics